MDLALMLQGTDSNVSANFLQILKIFIISNKKK